MFGFTSRAITLACGTSSDSSSRRFGVNSSVSKLTPVRLPPGRAKLATKPNSTRSPPSLKTIGIVEVAPFSASAVGGPPVETITSTLRLTSSAAKAGSRS